MDKPGLTRGASCGRLLDFAQGFPGQFHFVCGMQHPIQNGIGQRRIVQIGMPVCRRQLAGDQGGARADAVIKHLQQIVTLSLIERCQPPIVQDQQIRLGQRGEALAETPVAVGDAQLLEEARRAYIDDGQVRSRLALMPCASASFATETPGRKQASINSRLACGS